MQGCLSRFTTQSTDSAQAASFRPVWLFILRSFGRAPSGPFFFFFDVAGPGALQGASSSFIGVAVESSLLFGNRTSQLGSACCRAAQAQGAPSFAATAISAGVAGGIVSLVLCPTELIKVLPPPPPPKELIKVLSPPPPPLPPTELIKVLPAPPSPPKELNKVLSPPLPHRTHLGAVSPPGAVLCTLQCAVSMMEQRQQASAACDPGATGVQRHQEEQASREQRRLVGSSVAVGRYRQATTVLH